MSYPTATTLMHNMKFWFAYDMIVWWMIHVLIYITYISIRFCQSPFFTCIYSHTHIYILRKRVIIMRKTDFVVVRLITIECNGICKYDENDWHYEANFYPHTSWMNQYGFITQALPINKCFMIMKLCLFTCFMPIICTNIFPYCILVCAIVLFS